ncbi:type I restriction modification DNA specificity domain protein [Leptospira wolbachii serovar Codice str. CDC]|uniref:Type I restriction modification DNA specificity domain protein n=1 Tax=Leptospira wolbachii serovar Codice str. CDC TaxID=1218599 RepID=R9A6B2_9LEPT|nr:restriction endonuclease subunit S [Leptospira wolbachii]EOQ97652.1 type I restriction modification DNA specificity domain protein [Leptospira wolbachii serovar Codice str. CDC]
MNPLLQTHFDTALEHPNGIRKLRELILTLAMQGKLVPQDPNDPPASELLKEIQAGKARLVAEGKVKKSEALPPVKEEEKPFAIPKGWEWVRLGECIELISGQHLRSNEYNENQNGIPYFTGPADFGDISPIGNRWTNIRRAIALKGDILLTVKGAGIGKTNIVIQDEAAISRQLMALRVWKLNKQYLGYYLNVMFAKFQELATGIAIPGIGRDDVLHRYFPLPPLAEQKRIVEKIDELLALCDELERLKQSKDAKRKDLHQSVITQMLEAETHAVFQKQFHFLTTHFYELYAVKENVKELRKAVLQLAVMGKLVPHDPNDQPASELLKEIQAEKARLVAEGKIKKSDALPSVKEEEKPFVIPKGWEWVRLGEVGVLERGKSKHRPRNDIKLFRNGKYPLVQTGDVSAAKKNKDSISSVSNYYNEFGLAQSRMWDPGTLCITIAANIAETGFLSISACFPDSVVGFTSLSGYHTSKYVKMFIDTAKEHLENFAPATAQKNINLGILTELICPLPPMAEQKRIVEKVDQLMALCDDLEGGIGKAEEKRGEILEGMVRG